MVFGDSFVDPGNNNVLKNVLTKCNFSPYGQDFPGRKPTGRFSNGKIPNDIIAEKLGITEYLPAYLDPELSPEDLLTGVSFASGGSGYDPLTAKIPMVLSPWDQLEMFEEYKEKLKAVAGEERAASIVSESFYTRTLRGGITRECFDTFNEAALAFNSGYNIEIQKLNSELDGVKIALADIYGPIMDLIQNPFNHVLQISLGQAQNQTAVPSFPAVIVFGDSIVDPGNNNGLKTTIKCNFSPYGQNFPGRKPTGRFSNGKIPPDIIAERLGIKEYVPAYFDPELSPEDLLTGVSFASGASGYDPLTSKTAMVLSPWDQLEMFEEYKEKLKAVAGEERAAFIVSGASTSCV
ncbi:GDSL esterase/lipase [Acorus calamus]|uniref:GDSL esterase/lipase n=1 Tax=Acorus calamus TaxID=4465 RepID=A0AAV9F384_ACOCL|nr:GDSL esterase/lipase [Acorus calamus]